MDSSEEIVVIVDSLNNYVGDALRRDMRLNHWIHRSTFIFLIEAKTKMFYVQMRSKNKHWCPSHWDVFFGGVVQQKETYETSAQRELEEETGLVNQNFQHLFDMYFENERTKAWGRVFMVLYKGSLDQLKLSPDEVESIELLSLNQINDMHSRGQQFTPDGWMGLQKLIDGGFLEKI